MPNSPWWSTVVWTDYRLAVLMALIVPLVLTIAAFRRGVEPLEHLLMIYWRVASLSAITVYLLLAAMPLGFISGWAAKLLIPIALWFWTDLNEEVAEMPRDGLKLFFTSWRWAMTVYCIAGAIVTAPMLQCAFLSSQDLVKQPFCRTWLEPAWAFKAVFHGGTAAPRLGLLALLALGVYVLYLAYFVFIRLGKQGRTAVGQ